MKHIEGFVSASAIYNNKLYFLVMLRQNALKCFTDELTLIKARNNNRNLHCTITANKWKGI